MAKRKGSPATPEQREAMTGSRRRTRPATSLKVRLALCVIKGEAE
jgi:hypothetical protein